MSDVLRFPFGAPVKPCGTQTPPVAEAFILGAYPSALHVGWTMPSGQKVFAIAVDNEPEVFWDGRGEDCYFEQWKVKVGFDSSWGMFTPRANGPSGKWLHPNIYDH